MPANKPLINKPVPPFIEGTIAQDGTILPKVPPFLPEGTPPPPPQKSL